jgi:hypothetical protein
MIVDIRIQVHDEKIMVESKQKGYRVNLKNMLGSISSGMVVAIGQSLDDLIRENPHNADKFKEEVKFEQLYTPSAKGLENIQFLLAYQTMQLSKKKNLLSRLFGSDSLICNLELPGYEQIDADVRKQFEYSLFQMGVSNIWINNKINDWKILHRLVLKFSRVILPFAGILLWYGFVLVVDQYKNLINWALVLFIWVMSFVVFYYLSILIRILILRNFLPHDLLRIETLDQDKLFGRNLVRLLMSLLNEERN